jgi:hypothetical protein
MPMDKPTNKRRVTERAYIEENVQFETVLQMCNSNRGGGKMYEAKKGDK